MKITYYKNLDGIRAIAALMIMVFHFFQGLKPDSAALNWLIKISIFGQTGVTLFFVLSGFLITRILFSTQNDNHYFKNFYLRRALRIFPLYYFFLILYYFIFPYVFDTSIVSIGQQLYFYTYLQNIATTFHWDAMGPVHFWSLAVEEHFYLFWPLVVFFTTKKNLLKVIVLIIVGALLLRLCMLNEGYNVFVFTFTRFDSLAIGALLALLEYGGYLRENNAPRFLWLLGGVFLHTVIIWFFFTGEANYYVQIFKYTLLAFTYFLLIGYVLSVKSTHVINRFLEVKFLSYTGKISYGLYVCHLFAYALADKFVGNTEHWFANIMIRLVLTYAIASLSYYLLEVNFLKLKRYFDYNV